MSIINRKKLELIARKKLQYPLHDAEKDYFLTYVLNILSKSKLSNTLVFKGGTAIYHCYLDQYRFSEDLDFTSTNSNISLNDIQNVFSKFQYLEIKKKFVSKNTIKIERLKYSGILDTPNSTKIDIDKKQKVFLKPLNKTYSNVWGYNFSINVMDPVEICSEKIRACNERFRYRDFYDLYNLINILKIDLPNVFRILQKKN